MAAATCRATSSAARCRPKASWPCCSRTQRRLALHKAERIAVLPGRHGLAVGYFIAQVQGELGLLHHARQVPAGVVFVLDAVVVALEGDDAGSRGIVRMFELEVA